jgi:hypothetical protein
MRNAGGGFIGARPAGQDAGLAATRVFDFIDNMK